jgi:hypothetical protein
MALVLFTPQRMPPQVGSRQQPRARQCQKQLSHLTGSPSRALSTWKSIGEEAVSGATLFGRIARVLASRGESLEDHSASALGSTASRLTFDCDTTHVEAVSRSTSAYCRVEMPRISTSGTWREERQLQCRLFVCRES